MEELIINNMNLVRGVLHRNYPTFAFDEDLYQIGLIGLIYAAQRFDPERGVEFSTFATRCIHNELRKEFIRRCSDGKMVSLDGDEDSSMYDYIATETDMQNCEVRQHYIDFTKTLDEKQRQLLELRRNGVVLEEAGKRLGMTKSGVFKVMRKIKRKWNKWVEEM